ncbi:MAG: hypothetical protein MUF27_12845 [Acidobacteria bacterium]|nr:hypothetical protein [Acidobacteriota bacterium]
MRKSSKPPSTVPATAAPSATRTRRRIVAVSGSSASRSTRTRVQAAMAWLLPSFSTVCQDEPPSLLASTQYQSSVSAPGAEFAHQRWYERSAPERPARLKMGESSTTSPPSTSSPESPLKLGAVNQHPSPASSESAPACHGVASGVPRVQVPVAAVDDGASCAQPESPVKPSARRSRSPPVRSVKCCVSTVQPEASVTVKVKGRTVPQATEEAIAARKPAALIAVPFPARSGKGCDATSIVTPGAVDAIVPTSPDPAVGDAFSSVRKRSTASPGSTVPERFPRGVSSAATATIPAMGRAGPVVDTTFSIVEPQPPLVIACTA